MRRFIFILPAVLILAVIDLQAQQVPESFLGIRIEEEAVEKNAGKEPGDLFPSPIAEMPIYNPKDIDSKILIHKPEGIFYNMPVIGQKERLSGKSLLLDPGKKLFKNGPSDINEDQKDDSAEHE